MLLSDLVSEVISEVGGDPTDSALATKVFGFMKAGMRTIPALIRGRMLTTRQTFTMPANTNSYDLGTLSPSFIRERGFWYTDGNNKKVEIFRMDVSQFKQYQDVLAQSNPRYYNISIKNFLTDRLTPAALPIEVDYFCALTDSLTSSSTFVLGEDYIEMVKSLTMVKYYGYQEDDVKIASNKGDAKTYLDEMGNRFEQDEMGDFPVET